MYTHTLLLFMYAYRKGVHGPFESTVNRRFKPWKTPQRPPPSGRRRPTGRARGRAGRSGPGRGSCGRAPPKGQGQGDDASGCVETPFFSLYKYMHAYMRTYIPDHALHCVSLRYIALHHVTLRYTTIHYVTTTLHYTALPYITLSYITLQYNTLHYNTLHTQTLRNVYTHIYICMYTYIHM